MTEMWGTCDKCRCEVGVELEVILLIFDNERSITFFGVINKHGKYKIEQILHIQLFSTNGYEVISVRPDAESFCFLNATCDQEQWTEIQMIMLVIIYLTLTGVRQWWTFLPATRSISNGYLIQTTREL